MPSLQRQRERFAKDAKRWGFLRASHIVTMRLLARLVGLQVSRVYRRELMGAIEIPELPDHYTARVLETTDFEAAAMDPELDMSAEFIEEALDSGHRCQGVFYEERLVAYVWRSFNETPVGNGFSMTFQKPYRYGYKSLTLPEHRGQHLQQILNTLDDQALVDDGFSYAVYLIATHNYSSIRASAHHDPDALGWAIWITKGPLRWCHTSSGVRAIGARLVDRGLS